MFLDGRPSNNLSKRTLAGTFFIYYSWYCACLCLLFVTCNDTFVVRLYVNVTAEHGDLSHLPNLTSSVEMCRNDSYQRYGEENKKVA
jgi:hypothetical protein